MSPCVLRQGGADGASHGVGQVARMGDVAGGVLDGDREHAAGAFHDLGAHQGREAGAVGGGGHRQQAQFGAQLRLQVEAEGERQVGFQRALVDFVEDHRGDAIQAGIGLQAADQQALGDDLDAGLGRDRRVQPGAEADGAAERFAEQRGHARGGGAGGEAAWLQHQDFAVAAPGGVQQGQRHERGLAGAGRGDQHGIAPGGEVVGQGRQRVGDGKVGERRHVRGIARGRRDGAQLPPFGPGARLGLPPRRPYRLSLRDACRAREHRPGGRRATGPPPAPRATGTGHDRGCYRQVLSGTLLSRKLLMRLCWPDSRPATAGANRGQVFSARRKCGEHGDHGACVPPPWSADMRGVSNLGRLCAQSCRNIGVRSFSLAELVFIPSIACNPVQHCPAVMHFHFCRLKAGELFRRCAIR